MSVQTKAPATAGRIPSEFMRYWERCDTPRMRRARRVCRLLLRRDPLPDEARVLDFAHGYYDADPVAEAFIDDVYLQRGTNEGRRMLDQAIAHGVDSVPDAPESMRRLFEEFERAPAWLDPALVQGAPRCSAATAPRCSASPAWRRCSATPRARSPSRWPSRAPTRARAR
ncbi:MAG TPA: hypothetical protein VHX88_08275 [Solirubrobacteraceae bacterium]|nr:hypothetical protein [Solirubrobacteraceae bacterium]